MRASVEVTSVCEYVLEEELEKLEEGKVVERVQVSQAAVIHMYYVHRSKIWLGNSV